MVYKQEPNGSILTGFYFVEFTDDLYFFDHVLTKWWMLRPPVAAWIKENNGVVRQDPRSGREFVYFKSEAAALHFKMRWL